MFNLFNWIVRLTGMENVPPLMMKFAMAVSPTTTSLQGVKRQMNRSASFTLKLSLSCLALMVMIPSAASAAGLNNGQQLYMVHCAGCHGMNGISVIPQAKDFSRAKLLAQPDQSLIDLIRNGRDMMPAYLGILDDREILDVINYLRMLN